MKSVGSGLRDDRSGQKSEQCQDGRENDREDERDHGPAENVGNVASVGDHESHPEVGVSCVAVRDEDEPELPRDGKPQEDGHALDIQFEEE